MAGYDVGRPSDRQVNRVVAAARDCGLHLQDWSAGDETVLAIYDSDGYLGCIQLADGTVRMHRPWFKKDEACFRALASAFAAKEDVK